SVQVPARGRVRHLAPAQQHREAAARRFAREGIGRGDRPARLRLIPALSPVCDLTEGESSMLLHETAPLHQASGDTRWRTHGDVEVRRSTEVAGSAAIARTALEDALDTRRGMLIFRGADRLVGYVDPPVE